MKENEYDKYFVSDCIRPKVESWGPVASGFFNMFKATEIFPRANVDGSGLYLSGLTPFFRDGTRLLHADQPALPVWTCGVISIS